MTHEISNEWCPVCTAAASCPGLLRHDGDMSPSGSSLTPREEISGGYFAASNGLEDISTSTVGSACRRHVYDDVDECAHLDAEQHSAGNAAAFLISRPTTVPGAVPSAISALGRA